MGCDTGENGVSERKKHLIEEQAFDVLHRVARLANLADLVARAVCDAGVGHGVAVVSVRRHLDDHGPVALGDVVPHVLHAFSNR